jgi:hypothetical protein
MTTPQPFIFDQEGNPKRHAPATARNRDAIAAVLADALPARGLVLEIASGTGEHAVSFANRFPALEWQPSDPDPAALASIRAWAGEAGCTNLRPPLALDAAAADWPITTADAILCINMIHISPWAATQGLMAGAARVLTKGAPLLLYGPYLEAESETAESNLNFDVSLKSRNPAWGLRSRDAVVALATVHGFHLERRVAMPANNIMLVFQKG